MLCLFENPFIQRLLTPLTRRVFRGETPLTRRVFRGETPLTPLIRGGNSPDPPCFQGGRLQFPYQGGALFCQRSFFSQKAPGQRDAKRFSRTALVWRRRGRAGDLRRKQGEEPAEGRQRGVAVFEMLFLLLFFVTLFSFTLGFWGAAHTATLQSTAARHLAFEVLNNRTHYEYHRDWLLNGRGGDGKMVGGSTMDSQDLYLRDLDARFFFISGELDPPQTDATIQTKRGVNFFKAVGDGSREGQSQEAPGSKVIKIKTGYGILF